MITLRDLASAADFLGDELPEARVVSVFVRAADGALRKLAGDDPALVIAQQQAASRAAYRASKFAGLPEAVRAVVFGHPGALDVELVDKIVELVEERWPQ